MYQTKGAQVVEAASQNAPAGGRPEVARRATYRQRRWRGSSMSRGEQRGDQHLGQPILMLLGGPAPHTNCHTVNLGVH